MKENTRFDAAIELHTLSVFPDCDWLLIKAQVAQESAFNPNAKSPVGACGLLQLMPATAKQVFGLSPEALLDPDLNLSAGIQYLKIQYAHLPEIASHEERLKFALASYNAGRGYINKALALAYDFEHGEPIPNGHKGAKPGNWQSWEFSKEKLKSPLCRVNGKTPDWKQVTDYVEKIWSRYQLYKGA